MEENDISKQTLIVLVALSCVISIIGVIALVYELSTTQATHTTQQGKVTAEAAFVVLDKMPERPSGAATGFAAFNIGG